MTNHLQTTKEAYLEMMKSLLEERREITNMYYEVKSKVDEIDKLLMAGDSGKVSTGQAAEIMAYANLFNNKQEPKKEAPALREKLTVNIPINQVSNEEIDALRAINKANREASATKELPKPRPTTREDLITSSVADSKDDKHILPVEPQKESKVEKVTAHSKRGVEVMVEILRDFKAPMHVKEFYKRFQERTGDDGNYGNFQVGLSTARKKDTRIAQAGRGYYIYKG